MKGGQASPLRCMRLLSQRRPKVRRFSVLPSGSCFVFRSAVFSVQPGDRCLVSVWGGKRLKKNQERTFVDLWRVGGIFTAFLSIDRLTGSLHTFGRQLMHLRPYRSGACCSGQKDEPPRRIPLTSMLRGGEAGTTQILHIARKR